MSRASHLLLGPRPCARALSRGLTLIEIMVVLALVAMVTGVALGGSALLPSARLRRSATMIISAVKVAYTRATATSRSLRLVLDFDSEKIWLEETDVPMLVQSKDKTGSAGAAAATDVERSALEEGERLVKGPPVSKPLFHPIEAFGFGDVESGKGGKGLQSGITFRSVQTSHDETPRTGGRAYLYFWPGGLTESASIQVRMGTEEVDDKTMTLLIAPLTGKVTVKGGAVDLALPTDDDHRSERMDNGF